MSDKKSFLNTDAMTKGLLHFLGGVLLLGGIAGGVAVYQTAFAPTDRPAHKLTVNAGDTYHSLLTEPNWQDTPLSFEPITRLYIKFFAKDALNLGTYEIPAHASLKQVVDILGKGAKVEMVKIQIIEGKTVKDLYQILKNTRGISLELLTPKSDRYSWTDVARDNEAVAKALGIDSPNGNLEGQFAPNTYLFAQGTSDREILQRLHDTQMQLLEKAWLGRDKDLPYDSPYQALIMASIIEKETGIKSERNDVSAVFVNRLRQNMRLQTDPTIIYGLFDRYDGKIYRSNIDEKTDYNTYQIDGLPPTPIALPSAEAIHATMYPSDVPYIFFVATGKGGHKFSVTLDEHNKAVAEYRKVMANKE
ncbi:endolytic transglycosylase MltG [Moraxella oblonga]|uniref:endolytic transglycosylase MltG n=1 Tax=Moraxella oblonga TaxID=200413 RepID=UPI0009FEEB28|nr:endolytic transglycosylase MltG [Moraxella oblonga]